MTFGDELQKFTNFCQVLAGCACEGEQPLSDIGVSMAAALPRAQSPADFLMLRSIVTDFVVRALDGDPAAREHAIEELVRTHPPRDELGHALVRCLSADRRESTPQRLKSIQQLRADRAMAAIARRCAESSLRLRMVAEEVQVSGEYTSKLLHAKYGIGFRTAVRQARMRVACEQLEYSLQSVKEIAAAVGYRSTSQFDRDFRRERGLTPGEYRRLHPRQEEQQP